ncbi:NADH:flavin oxidoreductase/NADH oxidase [Mycena maculata]|uniref:NADH:flavin oxidoreductase/NADH oxidase n=1 Tax=Mycena maculata TaxID=230809 RepID=A0AAD7NFM0_9AGAR|nr:NADH:flavin oxidoreductase/NADH oxidase [Mycena maculata]
MSDSKLFQPIQVGNVELSHRVVLAPMTRFRADASYVPLPHVAEYYEQRASTTGSLLISEGTYIDPRAGGFKNAPGIWSHEQISAWKIVTDRVHAKGSFIFLQLWALGRVAHAETLAEENLPLVSASDVPIPGRPRPRPLTVEEIKEYVHLYAKAASNAVHKASFDGVEIHSANGYLPDQFLHDRSNFRADAYGGSPENRTRFTLEVVDAVAKAIGQKKTALRISPWSTNLDMKFDDPKPTYAHLISQLRERYPDIAYLHVVEPRTDGHQTVEIREGASNDFIRELWCDRRLISAGGYTRETAIEVADQKGDLIAFARSYIANPDLPYRLLNGIALTKGGRALYYTPLETKGYTDYPFALASTRASTIETQA